MNSYFLFIEVWQFVWFRVLQTPRVVRVQSASVRQDVRFLVEFIIVLRLRVRLWPLMFHL